MHGIALFFNLRMWRLFLMVGVFLGICYNAKCQEKTQPKVGLITIADGWASNSVNAVVFRKNSLVTYRDTQFAAFYNQDKYVVLAKRRSGSHNWTIKQTPYKGNTTDAHNSISIMIDGLGYLHMAWDHHNTQLKYCRSVTPGSLELTDKIRMIGDAEQQISYPEFFKMADGKLLFLYRNGASGRGNLVMNKYDPETQGWTRLFDNLISGEGARSAYWQAFIDSKGTIHISWVWRESADVASNHDMAYAKSSDGGLTWQKTNGEQYQLPITAVSAEYAARIPQRSELINQTSMSADNNGNPYIATYWREVDSEIPQFHIIYFDGKNWNSKNLGFRTTPFSLSGIGTKSIPISRPQVMVKGTGKNVSGLMIFRDIERNESVSAVVIEKLKKKKWTIVDLGNSSVGSWEPSFDTELWREKGILNLFVQKVAQVDGEGNANIEPQPVQVLDWRP